MKAAKYATSVESSLIPHEYLVSLREPDVVRCSGVDPRRCWGFRIPGCCSRHRIKRLLDGGWFNLDHRS